MQAVDQHISMALNHYANMLELHFKCDVLAYMGPIYPQVLVQYRETIERLKAFAQRPEEHEP
jgi:hypothetical protein